MSLFPNQETKIRIFVKLKGHTANKERIQIVKLKNQCCFTMTQCWKKLYPTPHRHCSVPSQDPRYGVVDRGKGGEAGRGWGGKRAVSHLDTLVDSIHYPVEETVVDILSQSISSILSLQVRPRWLVWQPQNRLRISPLHRATHLGDIQCSDHLFFSSFHGP